MGFYKLIKLDDSNEPVEYKPVMRQGKVIGYIPDGQDGVSIPPRQSEELNLDFAKIAQLRKEADERIALFSEMYEDAE